MINNLVSSEGAWVERNQYYHAAERPDMSRNTALAGKTVSSKGMNVTYDENGYPICAINCSHTCFRGTMYAVLAPHIDAVIAGANRQYAASAEDLAHLSNSQLARLEELRTQVRAGELSARDAFSAMERTRALYGYHASMNEFAALEPVKLPESNSVPDAASQIAMAMLTPTEPSTDASADTSMPASAPAPSVAAAENTVSAAADAVPTAAVESGLPNVVTEPVTAAEPAQGESTVYVPKVESAGIPYVVTEQISTGSGDASVKTEPAAQGGYAKAETPYMPHSQTGVTAFDAAMMRRESALYKAFGEQKRNQLFEQLFEQDEDEKDKRDYI
ncbi:MAG: hypothetical protein IJU66_05680 [Oscillospiraceae bacterium]|nr:hypothetical protein [Oscillospiraceae bacterium]